MKCPYCETTITVGDVEIGSVDLDKGYVEVQISCARCSASADYFVDVSDMREWKEDGD